MAAPSDRQKPPSFLSRTATTRTFRLARWVLAIWLYVAITGIIIYVMLYRLQPASLAIARQDLLKLCSTALAAAALPADDILA